LKNINQDRVTYFQFAFTFAILGLIYSIMLIGVYITSSHQGLSCLTWPTCPNGFGFPPPKFFYEHIHRTLVFILAISLYSFTVYTLVKTNFKSLKVKLIIASVLLTTQIILGWVMIETKLNPVVVASHLSTAVALFGIILVTLISLYKGLKSNKEEEISKKN
jgi:heme A synthase